MDRVSLASSSKEVRGLSTFCRRKAGVDMLVAFQQYGIQLGSLLFDRFADYLGVVWADVCSTGRGHVQTLKF